ncbi:MAG: general secretion pathway protein GspB [Gammaproteobacteria bacterium]|nr:general secretion pathway protein GspB [Gammaproteobacteria bacterium]NNJ51143.1 GspB domain-containing protein [Gammaproteobacteria bacterium]
MSYILDALKKSEQERGHGNVPDVQTVHSSSLNYRDDKKAVWPYILIVAVLLNLLAIGYFIINQAGPTETTQSIAESTDTTKATTGNTAITVKQEQHTPPAPMADDSIQLQASGVSSVSTTTTAGKNVNAAAQEKEPMTRETATVSETVTTKPAPQAAATDNSEAIIDFYELPDSIKQQIPTIIISAHVYSSNPLQRSIVINNNFMEEGEYVLDDLVLHEITQDGAVFNYRGTLFNYGVVSGWQ